jgi:hypothetical protein
MTASSPLRCMFSRGSNKGLSCQSRHPRSAHDGRSGLAFCFTLVGNAVQCLRSSRALVFAAQPLPPGRRVTTDILQPDGTGKDEAPELTHVSGRPFLLAAFRQGPGHV